MNNQKTGQNNACVHCGADCGKAPVMEGELKFCCNGCKTVYSLLHEKKLFTYYELEKTPGIRIENPDHDPRYEFLDNEDVAKKLLVFSEGDIAKVKLYIPVIHCASCIWLLEHLYKMHPGIRFSAVNFAKKEAEITFNREEISLREVVELLVSLHYIPDLSESMVLHDKKPENYKSLLYKMGVAGFVFINVMTYSLPAYFNGRPVEDKLGNLMAILSLGLTIPVVFYSGSDYILSAWKNLKKKSVSIDLPIAIGIITLFMVTCYEVLTTTGQGYSDSLSGFIFFLLVGKWYQGKSYEALSFERNYKSFFPIAVTKINKQVEESILLERVIPGDLLLIRNRELIPADSILEEGTGMIDYSFVTGESTLAIKKAGDFLYAGGRQMGGIIRVRVEKDVNQSHLTHLWNKDESHEKPTDKLQNLTDRVSRHFTVAVILIALAGFTGWMLTGNSHKAFFVFTAVLIVACPCALALSVPFTFGNAMRILGKNGMYIKNTRVIEKLTEIDTIVFDKTGTLTNPAGYQIDYHGRLLSEEEKTAVGSIARQSAHPLSIALANLLKESGYLQPVHYVEVDGQGIFGKCGSYSVRMGSELYVTGRQEEMARNGSTVFIAINGESAGYFQLTIPYRDGLDKVIEHLQDSYDLFLLTGDNDAEKEDLKKYFREERLFFNLKPQDKARFVETLQKKGKVILMTGDGLNDAGALMQSDVALAIANKAYQFSPASDAVLESGKFHLLERFILFAQTSKKIVYLSFFISTCYNLAGISIALAGYMSPVVAAILMPLSSVSVVSFATFATRMAGYHRLK